MTNNNKQKWNLISLELSKAQSEWETLHLMQPRLSPDEQRLTDIKKLIVEIKAKINSFEKSKTHRDL